MQTAVKIHSIVSGSSYPERHVMLNQTNDTLARALMNHGRAVKTPTMNRTPPN